MKKTYKNPTIKIVNIKPSQILINASGQTNLMSGNHSRGSRYSEWEDDSEDFDAE